MNISGGHILARLGRRELLRVEVKNELVVHCLEGAFWITQLGSIADIVIGPGQKATLTRPRHAVLQALEAGCVRLSEYEPEPSSVRADVKRSGIPFALASIAISSHGLCLSAARSGE